MTVLLDAVSALAEPEPHIPGGTAAQFTKWRERHGFEDVPEAVAARSTLLWAHLHGIVALEIEGNFTSMGIDPSPLYEAEVAEFVRSP